MHEGPPWHRIRRPSPFFVTEAAANLMLVSIRKFDRWVHESGNFHNYSEDYYHPFYDGFFLT